MCTGFDPCPGDGDEMQGALSGWDALMMFLSWFF